MLARNLCDFYGVSLNLRIRVKKKKYVFYNQILRFAFYRVFEVFYFCIVNRKIFISNTKLRLISVSLSLVLISIYHNLEYMIQTHSLMLISFVDHISVRCGSIMKFFTVLPPIIWLESQFWWLEEWYWPAWLSGLRLSDFSIFFDELLWMLSSLFSNNF